MFQCGGRALSREEGIVGVARKCPHVEAASSQPIGASRDCAEASQGLFLDGQPHGR